MNQSLEENLYNFTNAVRQSLDNKNWYSALTLALTLPDICGKLESPKKSSSKRYVHWFNTYLKGKYTLKNRWGTHNFLSGDDAYALRCAYLHQGEVNIEDQMAQKVLNEFLFVEPPKNGSLHCNQSNNLLQLQVDIFCRDICDGIEKWVKDVNDNEDIQQRSKNLMTIHHLGDKISF